MSSIPFDIQRKIFVLTGKRGGFGAMKPMLRLIRDDPSLQLQLVVTDQHVSAKFGNTIAEVEKEFSITAAVDMEQTGDSLFDRAKALGTCALKMAETLAKLSPDICVLYGDRGEVLATAMAATALGLPIAHLQGGDLSGSVDEQVRHAVTKLAQLHFPSTQESASRIKKMGEEEWRIHSVGDSHIDLIVSGEYSAPEMVAELLNLDLRKPIVVVLQHSETTAPDDSYEQMRETLIAVTGSGAQVVVVHPCSDVGYSGVIKAINEFAVGHDFRVRVNLEAPDFWGLLAIASVFVGNSSAGIIETPIFRLPTINVGRRQQGRLTAENVIHVPHDASTIRRELKKILRKQAVGGDRMECSQPYGDGKAGERIVQVLKTILLDKRLMVKHMTY
jgi:GDP/UDP-N,N'-diacetylbacillosamine 2-epimerase (hydrolysing)